MAELRSLPLNHHIIVNIFQGRVCAQFFLVWQLKNLILTSRVAILNFDVRDDPKAFQQQCLPCTL